MAERPKHVIKGMENFPYFEPYYYSYLYELYVVPSRCKEVGDQTFIYKNPHGKIIFVDKRDTDSHICIGEFVSLMSTEEKNSFIKNFDKFVEITNLNINPS